MSYGLHNPSYDDAPGWASRSAFVPSAQPYRGRFYHWYMGVLLAVGCFLAANLALGDPVGEWVAPVAFPPKAASKSHTTIDAETTAEFETLLTVVLKRLETST